MAILYMNCKGYINLLIDEKYILSNSFLPAGVKDCLLVFKLHQFELLHINFLLSKSEINLQHFQLLEVCFWDFVIL
jgi:hypothetical protein